MNDNDPDNDNPFMSEDGIIDNYIFERDGKHDWALHDWVSDMVTYRVNELDDTERVAFWDEGLAITDFVNRFVQSYPMLCRQMLVAWQATWAHVAPIDPIDPRKD